ncbi:MAG: tetratricopeptide (TPR) repeat protein [Flavobacteriales bacterium]|jgi:tetratricopeptide (TPR) repeat protein
MKINNLKSLAVVALGAIVLASCGGLGKMSKYVETVTYDLTPNPLIVQGDSITITINGKFPGKYFDKKAEVTLTPTLFHGESESSFKSESFQGEDAAGNETAVSYEEGLTFIYTDKIAYNKAMDISDVKIKIEGKRGSKVLEFPAFAIGKGVITTPYLLENDDKATVAKDNFKRVTSHDQKSTINYLVNSSAVRSAELRDADIKELNTFIKDASKDEAIAMKSLSVLAYASPEGEISKNENLAHQRAASASKVVANQLKRNKTKAGEGFYNEIPKGEDWIGFKELMQNSKIKDKELILRILEMQKDLTTREKEIRNLAATFVAIEKEILPKLRRSQMTLNYEITGKSDEEISNLAKTDASKLNAEELLYAATLTEDLDAQMAIYKKAEAQFAADYRGSNNVGLVLLKQNKLDEAKAQFEKSMAIQESAEAHNNMGIVARLKGDRSAAAEHFKKSGNEDATYNLGLAQVQMGDYRSAVNNFGGAQTLNAALAYALNGNGSQALKIVEKAEKESANDFYVAAVISARTNNADQMVKMLKAAIAKDASLKTKAMNDLEFRDFLTNEAFAALVK